MVAEDERSQMQQIARILSEAVEMKNDGNEEMVTERVNVTENMRGEQDTKQAIVQAAPPWSQPTRR